MPEAAVRALLPAEAAPFRVRVSMPSSAAFACKCTTVLQCVWGDSMSHLILVPTFQEEYDCREEQGLLPVLRAQLPRCRATDVVLADVSAVALLFCSVLGTCHSVKVSCVSLARRWQLFLLAGIHPGLLKVPTSSCELPQGCAVHASHCKA